MKSLSLSLAASSFRYSLVICSLVSLQFFIHAFPPAPDHVLYGMVRDEYGNPLAVPDASLILETAAGTNLLTSVRNGLEPGVNYTLKVPMDSGITADPYKPTALRPTVPFKLHVRIKSTVYLPIEMKADFSRLGRPGDKTRLDLTLGEDQDGDGLPDAWERVLLQARGGGTLQDINPNDDSDGDNLSNLNEYLAGTYAFDDQNGFSLKIIRTNNGNPVLGFMVIRGRTYTVLGSADLNSWVPVPFTLATVGSTPLPTYYAADTRVLEVEANVPANEAMLFFKLVAR